MKIRLLIIITGSLVAVAVFIGVVLISGWRQSLPVTDLAKLVMAQQGYLRDQASRGQPLPASVTLRDLVGGGYVSANDVRAFDGMDITFYPTVGETDPQAILVRVRMRDGVQIAAFADGSARQLPDQPPK